MRLLLIGVLIAVCLLSSAAQTAAAPSAAPKIEFSEIDCLPGPEHAGKLDLIYFQNRGDSPQDLSGWQLKSDPEDSQSMVLDIVGTLGPVTQIGATPKDDTPRVIISAGAHAVQLPDSSMWLWSVSEILRDPPADPPDYVRLYDNNGNLVDSMDCNQDPVPLQTAASVTPTPEPQVAAPDDQPGPGDVGGGTSGAANQNTAPVAGQTATTGQTAQASSGGPAAGSVGAPNAGIGSLAPVGTSPLAFSVGLAAIAAGLAGLIMSIAFLISTRSPRLRAVVQERRAEHD